MEVLDRQAGLDVSNELVVMRLAGDSSSVLQMVFVCSEANSWAVVEPSGPAQRAVVGRSAARRLNRRAADGHRQVGGTVTKRSYILHSSSS